MQNLSKSKHFLFILIYLFREIELRENLVGTGFINPPDEKSEFNNRITVVGKIKIYKLCIKSFVLNHFQFQNHIKDKYPQ